MDPLVGAWLLVPGCSRTGLVAFPLPVPFLFRQVASNLALRRSSQWSSTPSSFLRRQLQLLLMSGPPAATASVMSTVKSKTRTSSSIPIMRTGPSAGSKADPHALTLPPSNPALPASHVVASVRSDRLEEEAQRMETRLAALKVAMNTEKAEREKIKKTKAGTFWVRPASERESKSKPSER